MRPWDREYQRAGIPSSSRSRPSSTVVWALERWAERHGGVPRTGLDVGCGSARNALYLARGGTQVRAFDGSERAIAIARKRAQTSPGPSGSVVELLVHDLEDGLPATDAEVDLVLDVFVYNHQLCADLRRRYRQELRRVLSPRGRILIALAEPGDEYYGACPPASECTQEPRAVIDPKAEVGSVLFTQQELEAEFGNAFKLEAAWIKRGPGTMHGGTYIRHTLATLWRCTGEAVR